MKRFLAIALVATSAHAEFFSGNDLLQRMDSDSPVQRSLSLGYVMGVADAHFGVTQCAPDSVTSGQMRDMVRNYLTNVPGERHFAADSLVVRVLKAAWPCPERQRRGNAL